MIYVQCVNSLIKKAVKKNKSSVLYGQNINAGSCLGGLTRGVSEINNGMTLNTPNIENTLVGVGFGLMLRSVNSVFFMKQFDFLLLGIDHLVNTYNVIRQTQPKASFTIFPITVDSGFEGPQSALNNFDDFCSIAGIDGFSFTNKIDSEKIILEYLFKPGFRILTTGQRLLKKEVIDLDTIYQDPQYRYFQYSKGKSVTIVCFNHALEYGLEFKKNILAMNGNASLFSVNSHLYADFNHLFNDINITKTLSPNEIFLVLSKKSTPNIVPASKKKAHKPSKDKFIALLRCISLSLCTSLPKAPDITLQSRGDKLFNLKSFILLIKSERAAI
mgnify:CR=1 FL=1